MKPRLSYPKTSPEGVEILGKLEAYIKQSGLEPELVELVKLRASQINGCAFCIDMHTKDARSQGESEQRLYGLSAWREAPFYTPRERAALEWAEHVTLINQNHVPDAVYAQAREHFSEKELVDLTWQLYYQFTGQLAITRWRDLYQPNHPVAKKNTLEK